MKQGHNNPGPGADRPNPRGKTVHYWPEGQPEPSCRPLAELPFDAIWTAHPRVANCPECKQRGGAGPVSRLLAELPPFLRSRFQQGLRTRAIPRADSLPTEELAAAIWATVCHGREAARIFPKARALEFARTMRGEVSR